VTCIEAQSPAGNLEQEGSTHAADPAVPISHMVPEGTRFRLDPAIFTDAFINTWLDSRWCPTGTISGSTCTNPTGGDPEYGPGQPTRNTARIFVVALRDYGWFLTDTDAAGGDGNFEAAGGANPSTAAAWTSLGIDKSSPSQVGQNRQLLFGLITSDTDIQALNPPVANCGRAETANPGHWTSTFVCRGASSSRGAASFTYTS
jgi:hypothetical protein